MVNRANPEAPPDTVFTPTEIEILDRLAGNKPSVSKTPAHKRERTVSHYLTEIAKLGGYLARVNDPPPGNMVIWRGLTRLTDIQLGFDLRE